MVVVGEVTSMENLNTAIGQILEMVGTVLTTVLGNPVLALLFAFGIVGAVIGVLKRLKKI